MRLVIIPCSKEKRWHTEPGLGAVPAARAYTSPLHVQAQAYAKGLNAPWFVLSALHGLLRPTDLIPGDYDVTFSRPADPCISDAALAMQAEEFGLLDASELVIACPDDYAARIRTAVQGGHATLLMPLAGLVSLDEMTALLTALCLAPPAT